MSCGTMRRASENSEVSLFVEVAVAVRNTFVASDEPSATVKLPFPTPSVATLVTASNVSPSP